MSEILERRLLQRSPALVGRLDYDNYVVSAMRTKFGRSTAFKSIPKAAV
ncbi:MAG: hypothetical protein ABIS14_07535 [Sphingomonas sp.]